ncbi:MAG: hypothetical protein HFJ38_02385 [Bacilli bacterium]|nr:hypothetical protein [Bacilli bacterium]
MAKEKTKKSQTRVKRNQKLYKDTIITESYAIHHSIIFLLIISILANGFTIYHFITFNHNKVKVVTKTKTEIQEKVPENIVFLGDSITNRYDLEKYFSDINIVNSGKEGNKATDILASMKERVYDYNPSKLFLLIGTNDLDESTELSVEEVYNNIIEIIKQIQEKRNKAEIYIDSLLPVNSDVRYSPARDKDNNKIKELNEKLKEYCKKNKCTYIDMYNEFLDEDEHLSLKYTTDGLHLNNKGYEKFTELIKKYLK